MNGRGFQTNGLWSPSKAAAREGGLLVFSLSPIFGFYISMQNLGELGVAVMKVSIKGSDKNKREKPAVKKIINKVTDSEGGDQQCCCWDSPNISLANAKQSISYEVAFKYSLWINCQKKMWKRGRSEVNADIGLQAAVPLPTAHPRSCPLSPTSLP